MQAIKGGQYGVNGEFYKGGQFLPSSAYTVKGENNRANGKKAGAKKIELNAYNWVEVDSDFDDNYKTIFSFIGTVLAPVWETKTYSKERGELYAVTADSISDATLEYTGWTREGAEKLARMWNMGKRVITLKGLNQIQVM